MGLRSAIAKAAKAGIKATGDLRPTVVYYRVGDPTYDPDTGQTTPNETKVPLTNAARYGFRQSEIDGERVKPKDQQLLVLAEELGRDPTTKDRVEITPPGAVAENWNVQDWRADPSGATYTVHIRR